MRVFRVQSYFWFGFGVAEGLSKPPARCKHEEFLDHVEDERVQAFLNSVQVPS